MLRLVLIIFFFCFALPVRAQEAPPSVSVLAVSSLSEVMTELVRRYSRRGELIVSAAYGSPDALLEVIEGGEAADIYITDHPSHVRDLKSVVLTGDLGKRGLIDNGSVVTLGTNQLVLVAPKHSHLARTTPKDATLEQLLQDINEKTLLVLGDPKLVPSGMLAKQAIEKLGYWQEIAPFVVRAASTRNALYLITRGQGAGVVYETDTRNNLDLEVIATFPDRLHDKVVYHAAVVAGENMPLARKFLAYLQSDEAQQIFAEYGF